MISVGEMHLPSRLLQYEETSTYLKNELGLVSVYDGASLLNANALLCLPERPKEDQEHHKYNLLMLVNPRKISEIAQLCSTPDRETIVINRIRRRELEVMVTKPERAHHYALEYGKRNEAQIILRDVDPQKTYVRIGKRICEVPNPHHARQSVSVFDSKHVYPLTLSKRT